MDIEKRIHDLYEEVFNGANAEAAVKYLREDYRQHNPGVPQGRDGFIKQFGEAFRNGKRMNLKVLQVVAGEGLAGVLIGRGGDTDENGSLMDIYRFDENGMFTEHWDVFNDRD